MSAEIVYLAPRDGNERTRKIIPPGRDFEFPTVYRGRGFYLETGYVGGQLIAKVDDNGEYVRSKDLGPYFYALDDDVHEGGYFDCRYEVMDRTDPAKDSVSLVLRHHDTEVAASGHWAGWYDLGGLSLGSFDRLYRNEAGYFTLLPVPTRPWWPGPLLVYIAKVPYVPDVSKSLEAAARLGVDISVSRLAAFVESRRRELDVWTRALDGNGNLIEIDEYNDSGPRVFELAWAEAKP